MLNELEREILEKRMKRLMIERTSNIKLEDLQVDYFRQGNFTLATIFQGGDILARGITKRNAGDQWNTKIGEVRAFHTALTELLPVLF